MAYDEINEMMGALEARVRNDETFNQAITKALKGKQWERLNYLVMEAAKSIWGIVTETTQAIVDWCAAQLERLFT